MQVLQRYLVAQSVCFRENELLVEGLNFNTFWCYFLWIYFKILPFYMVPGPPLSNEEPWWLLSGPITGVQASTIERIESVNQDVMGLERGRGAGSVVCQTPEIWKKIVCSLSWGCCFLRFLPFALNHCPFHFTEFSLLAYAILHKLKIFHSAHFCTLTEPEGITQNTGRNSVTVKDYCSPMFSF